MKLKETKISAFLENCLAYFKKIRFLILDWCLSIRMVSATQGTFTDVGVGEGGAHSWFSYLHRVRIRTVLTFRGQSQCQ